ncbi:MAG: methionine ABC transporter ATP-binding protein [Peptococcaceae bacterium]|nr:methionine ABC transporter ATP-binding protein [Peptococcaceae bacterium]
MIELQGVGKIFHDGKRRVEAVKDINLSIADGDIYGIIGYSGAGKSTLVRCINLLERPTSGKVLIDGEDLMALPEKTLREKRQQIGMIFQQFNLFASRTVAQNVAYALRKSGLSRAEKAARVAELLDLVELGDKAGAYPSQLSGGQKQRVGIARALAARPKILLCDEATSALDPQTTESILKLLKQLNQQLGLTIVLITHEMDVVKSICNHVAVMEKGEIVERGDVFTVFANPQKPITEDFISTTSNLSKINVLLEENAQIVQIEPGQVIVKFKYLVRNASEALVSQISRKFDIDCNIIFGNIELIENEPLGGLVSIISGAPEDIEAAFEYLLDKNISVEVLKDARNLG